MAETMSYVLEEVAGSSDPYYPEFEVKVPDSDPIRLRGSRRPKEKSSVVHFLSPYDSVSPEQADIISDALIADLETGRNGFDEFRFNLHGVNGSSSNSFTQYQRFITDERLEIRTGETLVHVSLRRPISPVE